MQSWKVTCYPGSRIVGLTVYRDGRPIDGIVWHGIDDWSDAETVSVAKGSFHNSSVMQRVVQHIAAGELDHGQALELTADLRDAWERCQPQRVSGVTDMLREIAGFLRKG